VTTAALQTWYQRAYYINQSGYGIEAKAVFDYSRQMEHWVMRCGSFTIGGYVLWLHFRQYADPQLLTPWTTHTNNMIWVKLTYYLGYGHNSLLIVTVHWSLHEKKQIAFFRITGRKGTRKWAVIAALQSPGKTQKFSAIYSFQASNLSNTLQ